MTGTEEVAHGSIDDSPQYTTRDIRDVYAYCNIHTISMARRNNELKQGIRQIASHNILYKRLLTVRLEYMEHANALTVSDSYRERLLCHQAHCSLRPKVTYMVNHRFEYAPLSSETIN